jgi:hypothetical protein
MGSPEGTVPSGAGLPEGVVSLPQGERDPGGPPPDASLPRWLTRPKEKLAQFLKYVWKVYDIPRGLDSLRDRRKRPRIPTSEVARGLLFTALFRLPSLNALEGELKLPSFQRLLGRSQLTPGRKIFSADTAARVLDSLEHGLVRQVLHGVTGTAERNKVFREGWHAARRAVALDGWEPFCSYKRHCEDCLVRRVKVAGQVVEQYYHRFVVALLLGPDTEIVLDLEPLRTLDLRRQQGETVETHDGEQTAALRLLDRLHTTYGRFLDLFVLDGLYPNGPVMTRITTLGYGAVITLKKESDEPLKEALALMEGKPPATTWDDLERGEHIEACDVDDLETLDTFKGPVRVVRAVASSWRTGETHTWCAAVIGQNIRHLPARILHEFHRGRWHIENTAFNQWTQHWHLRHVYRHKPGAVVAVLLLWSLAFNLLQLFLYKRLRRPRTPRDPCDTIRALVALMARQVQSLPSPVPWLLLLDSS